MSIKAPQENRLKNYFSDDILELLSFKITAWVIFILLGYSLLWLIHTLLDGLFGLDFLIMLLFPISYLLVLPLFLIGIVSGLALLADIQSRK